MSRIYLIFYSLLLSLAAFGQDFRVDYIAHADEQYKKQDYITAIHYYEKALAIDSSDLPTLWKYAESLRQYRDYVKAERMYAKIYEIEDTKKFIRSLYYLGQMQKHNGKYDEALESFKLAKKKYVADRRGYLYLKSKQEIESCLWAKKARLDTLALDLNFLNKQINTVDSEFAHTFYQNTLFFSSLKADSSNLQDEIYSTTYKNSLYSTTLQATGAPQLLKAIDSERRHTGNGTFSLDGKRFYFSSCNTYDEGFMCKILVAQYNGQDLVSIDTLGEIINEEDANTTMPFITSFKGKETMFFSSDRNGGHGGLDLYYSHITAGSQFTNPKAISELNTKDNELSPFYDSTKQMLYFSSTWYDGFGGYDIFSSQLQSDKFTNPENLGIPINSSANDLYFFTYRDTNYFTTNRLGVSFTHNPTCCTDIMSFTYPSKEKEPETLVVVQGDTMTVSQKDYSSLAEMNRKLPVTLYFHNDIPNPRSTDTTTQVNYISSYNEYMEMIPKYKKEYAKGLNGEKMSDAEEDIESFFMEFVEQGVKDLLIFQRLLLEELQAGNSITLTVKGFASPLAKTDYNVNLTKRRIASLVNYLSAYGKGEFKAYLNGTDPKGTRLEIQQVPFGEYQAAKLISDNPNDQKNSVYSRSASLERKIEIQSVSFMKQDSVNYLTSKQVIFDLGVIDPTKTYTRTFEVENTGKDLLVIDRVEVPCHCTAAESSKTTLKPGETAQIKMTFDPKGYSGQVVKSVYVHVQGTDTPLRLVLTGEVK